MAYSWGFFVWFDNFLIGIFNVFTFIYLLIYLCLFLPSYYFLCVPSVFVSFFFFDFLGINQIFVIHFPFYYLFFCYFSGYLKYYTIIFDYQECYMNYYFHHFTIMLESKNILTPFSPSFLLCYCCHVF